MLGLLTSCPPATPLNFLARACDWTVSSDKYGHRMLNGISVYTPAGASRALVVKDVDKFSRTHPLQLHAGTVATP